MSSPPRRTTSSHAGFTRIVPATRPPAAGNNSGNAGTGGNAGAGQRTGAGGNSAGGQRTGAGGNSAGGQRTGAGANSGGGQRTGAGTGPSRPGGSGPARSGGGHRPGGHSGNRPGGGPSRGGPQPQRGSAPSQRRPEPPKEEVKEKEEAIELEGVITAVLAGTMFRVKLKNGHQVLAHISGKMRKKFIRLVIGDEVKLEMSPYDMDKARIVYRL